MDRVDIYDPATDTWTKGPKMPTRRNPGGVGVVNTRIYAIGGEGWPLPQAWGADQFLGSIEEYDPINRQWKKKKELLEVKNWFSSVVVEGCHLSDWGLHTRRRLAGSSNCECISSTDGDMAGDFSIAKPSWPF